MSSPVFVVDDASEHQNADASRVKELIDVFEARSGSVSPSRELGMADSAVVLEEAGRPSSTYASPLLGPNASQADLCLLADREVGVASSLLCSLSPPLFSLSLRPLHALISTLLKCC